MEKLQEIAQQLGLDDSFFYLFGIVVILNILLSKLYLRPYQVLFHRRKEKTEGAKKSAQEMMAKANEKLAFYQEKLKNTHENARNIFNEVVEGAKKEENRIIQDSANSVKQTLQNTQKELDGQHEVLTKTLASELGQIAAQIASKILGRQVSGAGGG